MDAASIAKYVRDSFPAVESTDSFGYTLFFYRDDERLPFASIAYTGNAHERVSQLDRPGVFRLNIGISRATFRALFGEAKVDLGGYDFTALDVIMPHPDYAPQHFICVLSPSDVTFEKLRPMLAEAYEIAVRRYDRRSKER